MIKTEPLKHADGIKSSETSYFTGRSSQDIRVDNSLPALIRAFYEDLTLAEMPRIAESKKEFFAALKALNLQLPEGIDPIKVITSLAIYYSKEAIENVVPLPHGTNPYRYSYTSEYFKPIGRGFIPFSAGNLIPGLRTSLVKGATIDSANVLKQHEQYNQLIQGECPISGPSFIHAIRTFAWVIPLFRIAQEVEHHNETNKNAVMTISIRENTLQLAVASGGN